MPIINGQPVPIAGYETGRFYTEEPTNGAIQCMGFAYLIYKRIWNSYTYGSVITKKVFSNKDDAKNAINSLKVGAMINCIFRGTGKNHSMIVIAYSATSVTVYDANWDGNDVGVVNKIGSRAWTYDKFFEKFSELTSGYNPTK